jgi:asparagine synthetase B (glutamine-hydrolysing)
MAGISFITRFIAYFPDKRPEGRNELLQVTEKIRATALKILWTDPYLLAVAIPKLPEASDTYTLLDIFPGAASSTRMTRRAFDADAPLEEIHRIAEASAQCYNLLRAAQTSFSMESDMLGLKPVHTARTPGGAVLASRIADALKLFPTLARSTDLVALYELLGFWAPLRERTLYRNVQRSLPGGAYRWTPSEGFRGRRTRRLQPAQLTPCQFMDQATANIRSASRESLGEKLAGAQEQIWLALSGGFDSRLIAALCRDLRVPIRAVTYSRPHHREWHSTKAVAQALKLELTVLRQDRNATLRYLPNHLDATEGNADCGSVSILNLLACRLALGHTLLHGFCGDLLSGGHIDPFSANDYASRDAMADAIVRHWYPDSTEDLRELFTPSPSLDDLRQDVLDGLRPDCPPYQAYLLWYAENRNRRYVASHFAVLGEYFDTVMPFYDRRLFELWFSVPPIGLSGQGTLRQLLARYYPALAKIPHPAESAPIIPNLRWQVARLWRGLGPRVLTRCIGRDRTRDLLLRFFRDDDFRSLSKLAAPQQRSQMLATVTDSRRLLCDALGLELSPRYPDILRGNLQALRTMFTVVRYVQRQYQMGLARS